MRYSAAERYQTAKIVGEVRDGKTVDGIVNGVAFRDLEEAVERCKDRHAEFGGVWIVADTKPRKRTDGLVTKHTVVFSTLTMEVSQ